MQVQVIENRADISGKVRDVQPHETLAHYYTVKMDVESVTPVEGMANLLGSSKGMTIDVSVPEEQVRSKEIVPGAGITLRVKKSGPTQIMAVPPPEKL
jgi:hypothetical protein